MKTMGKELVKQVLEKWRFPVIAESETGVLFRYQMNYIQASHSGDENSDAITMTLEGIFTADNDEEMAAALKTCNEITCNLLHVKLYVNNENKLVIGSEFFYKTEEDMEYLLDMALQSMVVAKKRFVQQYGELEEEAKLMSELTQQD